MRAGDAPPPRKKSRFFSNVKSVSAPRVEVQEIAEANATSEHLGNTLNSRAQNRVNSDSNQLATFASSASLRPAQDVDINLPHRSLDVRRKPSSSHADTPLSMQFTGHQRPLNSMDAIFLEESATRDRRKGIYGAEQLPSYQDSLQQPRSGLPSRAGSGNTVPPGQPSLIKVQPGIAPNALATTPAIRALSVIGDHRQSSQIQHSRSATEYHSSHMPKHLSSSSQQSALNITRPGPHNLHAGSESSDPFAGFQNRTFPIQNTTARGTVQPQQDRGSQSPLTGISLPVEKLARISTRVSDPGRDQVFDNKSSCATTSSNEQVNSLVAGGNSDPYQPSIDKHLNSEPLSSISRYSSVFRAGQNMNEQDFSMVSSTIPGVRDALPQQASLIGCPVDNTTIDLDRDATGALLPPHLRRSPILPSGSQIQGRYSVRKHSTPANLYTSPKRIERVIESSSSAFKRKHPALDLPPPSHIYIRSDDPDFNVFSNGLLLYPELCFVLASHMPLKDLISLYSISRDFHTIVDSRFTTICLSQALCKAPESARTFAFRSYADYCRDDPAARPHPNPRLASLQIIRKIPSFRWVAFVLHREKVVHELMTVFAERGTPLPARCSLALKKMWTLLDIPDNARRVAIIHNHHIFTDLDLYFMMCFLVKLDMIAHDPVAAEKRDGFRKLLLSQKDGLSTILKVLKREMWQKSSDFVVAWVRTMMSLDVVPAEQLDNLGLTSIFGVPREQVGVGKYEYWGLKGVADTETGKTWAHLLRPDQLVIREAIRRGMPFTKHFSRCVLYGYVRPDTLEDYRPREYGRRVSEWRDEEYEINDSVGGIRALAIENGGDSLLDLGDTDRGSPWTIKREAVSSQEQLMRDGQEKFLMRAYEVSDKERGA